MEWTRLTPFHKVLAPAGFLARVHPQRMIAPKVLSLLLLLPVLIAAPGHAEENRYDVLARVLDPLLAPFERQTPNPNRSMDAEFSLVAMTGVPPQFIGTKVRLAVEYPDKMYIHAPLLGEELTVCRNAKDIWVYPAAKAGALLPQPKDSKKKVRLGDLELPFSQAQLVFLPALFQVKEYAEEQVNGVSCRILELSLLPEIAHSLGIEEWLARLWVGPDYKIAKLEVLKPGWHVVVGVDRLAFAPKLSGTTWKPTPEQSPEVMHLKTAQLVGLMEAIGQSLGK